METENKLRKIEKKIELFNFELLVLLFSCMLYYNMIECFWTFDSMILHKNSSSYHFLNMKLGVLVYPFMIFTISKLRNMRNGSARCLSIFLLSLLYCILLYIENIPTFPIKVIGAIIIYAVNVLIVLFFLKNYELNHTGQFKANKRSIYAVLPLFLIPFIMLLVYVHFIIL